MSTWITFYSWCMAFIYPAVNVAIFIAALSAARQPTFRREFYCLAVAAALSVFCSAVLLLLRLHSSFALPFFTVELRRGLLIPHDLAEIVGLVIYCVGFFSLARRIRGLSHATTVA